MRNKKMAKRIAVAMLAAATTFSSVPAAAVFAADTSVEASDAKINDSVSTKSWSVNGVASTDLDATTNAVEIAIGNALLGTKDTPDLSACHDDDDAKTVLQGILKTAAGANHVWTVESTTLYSKKGNGDVVVITEEGKKLTYTFTTATAGKMNDDEIEALDAIFESTDAITYDGNTINTAVVQKAFNTALAKAQATKNSSTSSTFWGAAGDDRTPAGTGNAYKGDAGYTVKSATVSGDTVTGTIERTAGGNTYTYSYTAKAVQNEDSKKATVKQALASIEATTYPQPAAATDGTDNAILKQKIQDDLNTALDGKATATLGSGTVDLATRTANGSYNASVDNNNVNVPLKYSSQSKLNDAIKLAEKTTLKDARAADTLYSLKVDNTNGTAFAKDANVTDDADEVTGTVAAVKKFSATSTFSRTLQPTSATKAVDSDDVKDAVLKLFTDAADTAKYTGDGVTYTAESVKFGTANTDTADKTADATIKNNGKYLVKVTATIDNDFYGWKINGTEQKNATSTATWYVEVETPKLKEVKNTGISFADKKVVYTTNAYNSSANGLMKIDLKAVLTPDGSNSDVTYTIVTNDKKNPGTLGDGSAVYYTNVIGTTSNGTTTYAVDGNSKYTSKKSELYVPGKGTYKIKATANGKTATATITVLPKFNDVRPGAFYENPINKAYASGVTSGKSEDTFGVNDNVTRAQFVTWLYKAAVAKDSTQEIADTDLKAQFSDVATSKYYAKAVQWAVANKITAGTSATTFSPDQEVTRAQAVTMLWKYVGKADTGATGSDDDLTKRFTDLPSNKVFSAAITWAVNHGITSGTTLTTFSPDTTATRAQAITFINNTGLLD